MGNTADSCAVQGEPVEIAGSRLNASPTARKVFIAIPSFWHIDPHFHQCCLKAFSDFRDSPDVPGALHGQVMHSFGDSPNVGRSRNMLTHAFLKSDCTDLLFIDSDLIFNKAQIDRIVAHEEDVVGGIYCKKQEGPVQPCINSMKGAELKENGLAQVAYIGTGFLRIRRAVFERMIAELGEDLWYNSDTKPEHKEYCFWGMGVYKYKDGNRRWLSEDWFFCQRCMDLGIKVFADRRVVLKHSGHAIYPLSYQEREAFDQRGETASIDNSAQTIPHSRLAESTLPEGQ